MLDMQSLFRTAFLVVASFFAFPVQAQLLDQMVAVQAATTSAGKGADSTTKISKPGQALWSSRTFSAKTSQSCVVGKPSAVGIANGGAGTTTIDMRNAKGEVSITWNFGSGIPASRFPYSALQVALVNSSGAPDIYVGAVAVLSTNVTPITIGHRGVRVDRNLSPGGRIVPFKFESVSPALFKNPSIIIRSLTLRLLSPAACDTSFTIHSARFVPRTIDKSKSKDSDKVAGVSTQEGETSSDQSSSSSSGAPSANPCNDDPEVARQVQKCEDDHNRRAGGCAKWECSCLPTRDRKGYDISAIAVSGYEPGQTCTNNLCDEAPGKCDFGDCIPPQFYGYSNPSITIGVDGVSYQLGDPQTDVSWQCFDGKNRAKESQLCDMTVAQVEEQFLASMKVGAPCEISPGKKGECSNLGQCVPPDVNSTYYCKDKVDCTKCKAGKLCWQGECLSLQERSRKLCEATHIRGGGVGVCSPCYATFDEKPGESCGTGVQAPHRRGFNMDGATCSRPGLKQGTCSGGQCVAAGATSASSGSSSSR
jgi:hypothetical protein